MTDTTTTLPEPKKQKTMVTITEGVEFDTIAREWRCKWSADNDKKSLVELQKVLEEVKADIKKVDADWQTFSSARGSGGSEPGIIGEMLLRWPGKSPRSPRSSAPTSVANSSAGGCAGWPERGLSGSAREGEREGVSAIECVF